MAGKRTAVSPRGNKRYVRRDAEGRFSKVVDAGRSLSRDRKRKAKKVVPKGQGDKGDQRTSRQR